MSSQQLHRRRRPLVAESEQSSLSSVLTFSDSNEKGPKRPIERERAQFSQFNHFPTVVSLIDDKLDKPTSSGTAYLGPLDHPFTLDEMAYGDRTQEFRTIGKNLQLKTQLSNGSVTTGKRKVILSD